MYVANVGNFFKSSTCKSTLSEREVTIKGLGIDTIYAVLKTGLRMYKC